MDQQQAASIYQKYREGTATPEELALLEQAYLRLAGQQDLPPYDAEKVRAAMWKAVAPRKPRTLTRWLPYAAAVAVLVAVGWLLWDQGITNKEQGLAVTEILPGGNRATLTLADGRTINLDEAQTGIVVGAEDITYDDGTALEAVILSGEGEVSRGGVEGSLPNSGDASVMLALTTPKGGTYQITLPDGSRVWLNSESTLKYPSRFSEDSREVILEGEAYFDIVSMDRARITDARERSGSGSRSGGTEGTRAPASNFNSDGARYDSDGARVSRVPFKVLTSTQTVEVLGTQFNISAYADEVETKTTLVEGKVRVGLSPAGGGRFLDLKPGSQSTLRGAQLEISEVNTEQYTSWKNGLFDFTDQSLETVMRQLSRWYDIEVVYEGAVPHMEFYGKIYRNKNLSEVLELLESAQINFRVEAGRKLIITKN